MKTLLFFGSPRPNGDTYSLINLLLPHIVGDHKIINAYKSAISPCIDCRYCWTHAGCAIQDEMQEIYRYIQECDNIIIASPIYFSELTSKLLDVGSRLQTYFCARFFRKEEPIPKKKRGAVILVGGGDGNVEKPYDTACTLLHHMNCFEIHAPVFSHNTNTKAAIENPQTLAGLDSIIEFLYGSKPTSSRA